MLKRNFPLGKFQYNLPFAGILTLSSKASEINIRKEILQKPSFPRIKRKACQMSQETEIEDKIILYKIRCNFKTGNAKSISLSKLRGDHGLQTDLERSINSPQADTSKEIL